MSDLERFKKFYKEPNQEDYDYFKKKYIKGGVFNETLDAFMSIMQNLDFEDLGNGEIRVVENKINFDSLHPIVQSAIKAYFLTINVIK